MRHLPTRTTLEEASAIMRDSKSERFMSFRREFLSSQPALIEFFRINEPPPLRVVIPRALEDIQDILLDRITTEDLILEDQGLAPNNIPIVLCMILAVKLELEKHGGTLPIVTSAHIDAFRAEIRACEPRRKDRIRRTTEAAIMAAGKKFWNAEKLQYYSTNHKEFMQSIYNHVWAVARAGGANKTNGPQTLFTVLRLLELAGA